MTEFGEINADLGQALQLMEACQWDQAIVLLRAMVDARPFDCRAISKLGFALWKKGERKEGAATIEKALQLDPDDGEVIKDCMHVFLEAGRVDDARQILESYVQRNPWDWEIKESIEAMLHQTPEKSPPRQRNDNGTATADVLVGLGEEEFAKGNTDRARVCFEMALEKNPTNAKAYNNMGVLAWHQGDLKEALSCFEKALDLASHDGEILLNATKVLEAAGEYEMAAQLLEIYLTAHPTQTEAWKDYRELVRKSAQSWSPENLDVNVAQIYLDMGRRLAEVEDIQGAAEAFARAARIDPNNQEPYHRLGLLHMQLGQLQEALEMLEHANSLADENGEVAEALEQVRQQIDASSAFGVKSPGT